MIKFLKVISNIFKFIFRPFKFIFNIIKSIIKVISIIFDKIFNDVIVNTIIVLILFFKGIFTFKSFIINFIHIFIFQIVPFVLQSFTGAERETLYNQVKNINLDYISKNLVIFLVYIMVLLTFLLNWHMLKYRNYETRFTKVTIKAISLYCYILALILILVFSFLKAGIKIDESKNYLLIYISLYFVFIAWIWILYFSFCIRLLNSINVKYSIFIAISVKSMLVALVAWLAIYRYAETITNYYVNILISVFGLLYPILDMYKYVSLELDKYIKENVI